MNLMNRIQRKNILVVGDLMLDTYFRGEVKRISPEAPVPVFRKLSEQSVPGGAANVAVNLAAANQQVSIAGIIGNDVAGMTLREKLIKVGIDVKMLLSKQKKTTQKIRFIAENNQQVIRLDDETVEENQENERILELIVKQIDDFDIIILSDYNKGLLTESFSQAVINLAQKRKIIVLADVKSSNTKKYEGVYLLKPNLLELHMMTGMSVESDADILHASQELREVCRCTYVLTTRGGKGMLLSGKDFFYTVDADDYEVFDVTGAGDTALAYLAASLANGISINQSVEIANHAAGLQVTKVGTSAVTLHEVSEVIASISLGTAGKLLNRKTVSKLREFSKDKKIVFTNGCFDLLHTGHIRYLQQAAQMGDILVVGLNSDSSVRRLKGKGRPINTQSDRAEILAALECIDYIVIFEEDTPYELIREIQPDVLVKGGDYEQDKVVGKDIVEAHGGEVIILNFVENKSTTEIIKRIRDEG